MKKLIVFEEEEFSEKLLEFVKEFQDQAKKGYGVRLVSNEDDSPVITTEELCGSLMLTWDKVFNTVAGKAR